MRTINIKLPIDRVQEMDDRGQLNPSYIGDFVYIHTQKWGAGFDLDIKNPTGKLSYYYTLKVNSELHSKVKSWAKESKLPVSELLGRLFVNYYDKVKSL